jgi:hypothetical protein
MRTTTLALALFFWCLSSTTPRAQDSPDTLKTYWTSGIRLNQGHLIGMLGVTRQISSRILVYTGADLGGPEYAAYGATMVRITKPNRFTLYANLGPQIETIERDDDPANIVTYLTAATGVTGTYDITPTTTAWAAVTYLITGADLQQWKIGAGLAIPLEL